MKRILIAALIFLSFVLPAQAQISGAGQLGCSNISTQGTAWNSGTSNNSTQALLVNTPATAALVQLDQTTTITGGAVTFQISYDGGANYVSVPVAQVLNASTGAQLTNPYTLVASTNQAFLILLAGASNFQLKLTSVITGTGAVTPFTTPLCTTPTIGPLTLDASGNLLTKINFALPTGANVIGGVTQSGNWTVRVVGNAGVSLDAVIGAAAPANVFAEGLKDIAGNSRAALSDTTGRQYYLSYPDTTTGSYHASANVASVASATDIAVLPGNATNTVVVYRVQVSCTQTTAGIITLQLIKRSAADSAGTSSNMVVVPDDANYSAGVSVPKTYTVNPSTGTAIGNSDTALVGCLAPGTAAANDIYVFRPTKPIILRGTAQQLAVNLNGVTVTGGSFDVTFDYAETTTP